MVELSSALWSTDYFPRSEKWTMAHRSQVIDSPYSGTEVTREYPGKRWRVRIEYPPMFGLKADEFDGLIGQLNGQQNRIRVPRFSYKGPKGVGGGEWRISGNAGARVVQLSGLTGPSGQLLIARGTLFQLTGRLYRILNGETTPGTLDITIDPYLRRDKDGEPCQYTGLLRCMMRLADDEQDTVEYEVGAEDDPEARRVVEMIEPLP
jgi:hypothetical protein